MKILTRLADTFADFAYRFRKRRLEDALITASILEQNAKAARLHRALCKLRYDRMNYLSGRIDRKFKLTLVK